MVDIILEKIKTSRRILILGDSGRGKTTLANKLSKNLDLPFYSTDDFFWKIKFTEPNSSQDMINKAKETSDLSEWIIEGGSARMVNQIIDKADLIINLEFRNIFSQWYSIIKRNRTRDNESFMQLIDFLIYVARKRFNIGMIKQKERDAILEKHKNKLVRLSSYKEIDNLLNSMTASGL